MDLIGGTECGVEEHVKLFQKAGIWIEDGTITPEKGDIVVFNWDDATQPNDGYSDHIGVVRSVASKNFETTEGNMSGGIVGHRTVPIGWGYIRGFARPKYAKANTSTPKEDKKPTSSKLYCGKCGGKLWKHNSNGYVNWHCSSKMAKGDIKCTGVSTTSVKVRKIYSEISKDLVVNKSEVKASMLEWLHKLKASLQIEDKSEAAQKAIEQLERKKNKLTEAYLDEIISKEDYKAKYSALEDQIKEQQKLLIPVEENEDVKDIEAVIENIDKEIDTYIASSQFEDSKVDYLIEHTKKITVIDKEHYVIDLDLLAGVILIGKDFLLYVHNTMHCNRGRRWQNPCKRRRNLPEIHTGMVQSWKIQRTGNNRCCNRKQRWQDSDLQR